MLSYNPWLTARKTCGKIFKEEWKISMGYKTCKELRHGKLFEHAFIKLYMAINFVRIYMSNFYIVVSLSLGPHLLFHNVFFSKLVDGCLDHVPLPTKATWKHDHSKNNVIDHVHNKQKSSRKNYDTSFSSQETNIK